MANKISRREFLSSSALLGAAGMIAGAGGVGVLASSCSSSQKNIPLKSNIPVYIPETGDKAIPGKAIKAGIIGCGDRGGGAAFNFLDAADDVTIVAMADIFSDRLESLRGRLRENKGIEIDDSKIYYGFEAYKQLIDDNPDIEYIIIATPSIFHAMQTKYAVERAKNVFCEKAAGIDPVSCRTFLQAVKQAKAQGTSIGTGTQRHHDRAYNESYRRVREGVIGDITHAYVQWNQGHMSFKNRRPEWTDMEYMLRDFFSWNWLCGDHVIDQLVHNIDVFTWFSHLKPVSVVGMGSQLRRTTGDIYDNFALDIDYGNGVKVTAMARQIDGCANNVSEQIYGTKGWWNSGDMAIRDLGGNIVWQFDKEANDAKYKQNDPYVLEHMDLINHIRKGESLCEAETTVISSLTGAMGRESAYTGKFIKWDEFLASDLDLMLPELHLGNIPDFEKKFVAPLPGKTV